MAKIVIVDEKSLEAGRREFEKQLSDNQALRELHETMERHFNEEKKRRDAECAARQSKEASSERETR